MTILDVLRNDFRLIRRDLILFALLVFVVYIGVVLRFLLPWADNYLALEGILPSASLAARLRDYYPLVVSFMNLFTGASLSGAIFGFLILAEKDENTLKAILVSPMSARSYMNYRILLCTALAFLMIVFIFYAVNVDLLPLWPLLGVSLAAALTAPLIMLFLTIISDSRVQGLSYGKFISVTGLITLISWWVEEPLQFLFGVLPPYWASKAYWAALASDSVWPLYLGAALLAQGLAILLLRNLFIRRVYQSV